MPARFVANDAKYVLEADGMRLTGMSSAGTYSAPTNVVLSDLPAALEVELVKGTRVARFGVLRQGANRDHFLGNQQGGVGLLSNGSLWVDDDNKREGLAEIKQGAKVRIEWWPAPEPKLLWTIDDCLIVELPGNYHSYAFAVGGTNDCHIFALSQLASPLAAPAPAPAPALLPAPVPVAACFVANDAKYVLEADGMRLTGMSSAGTYSAPTNVVLSDLPAALEVELVKGTRVARFGVLRQGANRDHFLGNQQGGVGLLSNGSLWVDDDNKREGLAEIKQGAKVRIEWWPAPEPKLLWTIDDCLIVELPGNYHSYAFAVGGTNDCHIFALSERPTLAKETEKEAVLSTAFAAGIIPVSHLVAVLPAPPLEGPTVLIAAAVHAFEHYYAKPYDSPASNATSAYYMDLQPVPTPPRPGIQVVHRPNHGLANALRKACLIPDVVNALRAKLGSFTFAPDLLQTMQVAMVFEVCGRKSDIGFSDDPDTFTRYHTASCMAFEEYTASQNFDAANTKLCLDALQHMYMDPKSAAAVPIKTIFEVCHDLDLFRCYGANRMEEKVRKLKSMVGEEAGEHLARLAVQMIRKTGDRILFSPFADLPTGGYMLSIFPKCSHDAQACIDAISGVLPSLKLKKPGPFVQGEAPIRFIASRFKLMYEAQKLKWDLTEWDSFEIQEQKKWLRRSVRDLIRAYCATNSEYASADCETYADEFLEGMTQQNSEEVSVWMWTSAHRTHDLPVEFCSILNEALRVDVGKTVVHEGHSSVEAEQVSPMLEPATMLTCMLQRFLNVTRRKKNDAGIEHEAWPNGDGVNSTARDTVFRGGGLPSKHFAFFKELAGKNMWYRVPHPLASSFMKRKARDFIDLQAGRPDPTDPSEDMPKVLFIIQLDVDGCLQGNYVERVGQVKGEREFLFSAYSAFKVISAKSAHVDDLDNGIDYEITLKACRDNKDISDDVPTAPWH